MSQVTTEKSPTETKQLSEWVLEDGQMIQVTQKNSNGRMCECCGCKCPCGCKCCLKMCCTSRKKLDKSK